MAFFMGVAGLLIPVAIIGAVVLTVQNIKKKRNLKEKNAWLEAELAKKK